MPEIPKISIIIPVRDQLDPLRISLRFFDCQSYPGDRMEVIVVDDGSAESVSDSLNVQSYRFPLTVLSQPNRGRAAARNRGSECAAGELMIYCDADRIPDRDFVEAHALFQQRHPKAAVFGSPLDCFYGLEKLKVCSEHDLGMIRRFSREPEYYRNISKLFTPEQTTSKLSWIAFLVGNSCVRREVFRDVGGFDESFRSWGFEHFEFAFRLLKRNIGINHNRAARSFHIPHSRDKGAFRRDLARSVRLFERKHPEARVDLLESFMLGEIALQEMELRYSGEVTKSIAEVAPLRMQARYAGQHPS